MTVPHRDVSRRSLVVVAVDGAPETERTVQQAVRIARQRDADLHAVQVVPRDGTSWQARQGDALLEARVRALQPAAEQDGVSIQIVTVRGEPGRVLPAYAQLEAAGLIIVGRHYGSSRLWRNGVVVNRLSRSSPVPVLVVPGRREDDVLPSLDRIVIAVDHTVASAMALRTAVDLSTRHGAALTMVHALAGPEQMAFRGAEALRFARRLPADPRVLAERLEHQARSLGARTPAAVVTTGEPSRGILDVATGQAADLIVMGVAPRTWIDEALAGSTLRTVLHRAAAAVLVVPVVGGAHEWLEEEAA